MKPFNLEEALAGKPVVTRDGRKVTEIYYFKNAERKLVAIIDKKITAFHDDGLMRVPGQLESPYDLFMAEEEKEMCWICNENKGECLRKDKICTNDISPIKAVCGWCKNYTEHGISYILSKRIKALEEKLK